MLTVIVVSPSGRSLRLSAGPAPFLACSLGTLTLAGLETCQTPFPRTAQAEPSEDEGSAVSIRARLPDGSSHVRRFGAASPVADVHQWVRGLEGMPPWDPSSWRLVSSFPRAVLDPGVTVGDCALGGRQVMVFVERAGAADADA